MNLRVVAATGLIGAAALVLPACKNREEATRQELADSGYELTPEAYFRAAESDDVVAMEKMIRGGIAVQTLNTAGDTALHAAAIAGMKQSAKFLLDRKVPVDVAGSKGRTPLMAAVLQGQPDMVRFLLKQGADPMKKDAEGYRPLLMAVREGRADMIAELAPYDREDMDNALLAAALLGKTREIDELANYGASVYARMNDGRTSLMVAAENGHLDAVQTLVEIGANRFSMDDQGRIAADLAREAGHEDIAKWLSTEPTKEEYGLEEPEQTGEAIQRKLDRTVAVSKSGVTSGKGGSNDPSEASSPVKPERAASLENGTLGALSAEEKSRQDEIHSSPAEQGIPVPLIMRGYRQKELPVRVESVSGSTAYLRVAGRKAAPFAEGSSVPGSQLKVVRVLKKMRASKENEGVPLDVSVVEVEDGVSGQKRQLITGEAAAANEPTALVEDAATGKRYVAQTGQHFRGADGTTYRIADVRPNQMVVENPASGEVWTVPLRGPRG